MWHLISFAIFYSSEVSRDVIDEDELHKGMSIWKQGSSGITASLIDKDKIRTCAQPLVICWITFFLKGVNLECSPLSGPVKIIVQKADIWKKKLEIH